MATDKGLHVLAASIVLAAFVLVLVPIVWWHWQEHRAERALAELSAKAEADVRESSRQAAVAAYQQKPATPARQQFIPLRSGETCTGGFVVRPVAPPARGWEQVLELGQPARCSGQYRTY